MLVTYSDEAQRGGCEFQKRWPENPVDQILSGAVDALKIDGNKRH